MRNNALPTLHWLRITDYALRISSPHPFVLPPQIGYNNSMSIPPREEFRALVMKLVKGMSALVKILPAKDGFAVSVNGNLASLESLYRMASLRPDDVQQHVNRWVVELLRAAEGTHDQEGSYEELKPRILPLVLSSEGAQSRGPSVVTQPFVEGLIVAYAI